MVLDVYRPEAFPPDLAEALGTVHGRLGGLGQRFLYFSTVDSTNNVASAIAGEDATGGVVVIADAQTAGRGRRGRTWFSPPGSGLYVSVLIDLAPDHADPEREAALLTLAAGVALSEAVETAAGVRPEIKWPNDLLVHRRKIAGILAEGVTNSDRVGCVVLGYGINVRAASFPPELADRASSLETELGRPVDRAALCVESLAALERRRRDLADGRFDAILDAWRARAPGSQGAPVAWQSAQGPRSGVTIGIDDRGALLVRAGDRVERIFAGDVVWA
jgi:BirA family transcriptional regulator, biotin operon repressor / biotin---[acetyl-CoA-carboxylase] ligase